MSDQKMYRKEIDLCRLLMKCEKMCEETNVTVNWRLPKFIQSAENIMRDLRNERTKMNKEKLDEYSERIAFLKGLLETKNMESTIQKSIALQMLAPTSPSSSNKVREIYMKNVADCEIDLRNELMKGPSDLRRRTFLTEPSGSQELDSVLKYHQEKHERIASDMLSMTRNMKELSELAGKIIRDDTKVLEKSAKIMDDNYHSLQRQSNRLQDFITRSGWRCWIWVMLAAMMIIFINMVFFMKISRKKY